MTLHIWLIFHFFLFCFPVIQAALARLEALENDNAGVEVVDLNDDGDASLDDDDDQGVAFFTLPISQISIWEIS